MPLEFGKSSAKILQEKRGFVMSENAQKKQKKKPLIMIAVCLRSEERRVGKECDL